MSAEPNTMYAAPIVQLNPGRSAFRVEVEMARGVRDERRVNRQRAIIRRVLLRAKRKGWDETFTAQVIVQALSPARVAAGVVGPCFYCFDELAATVDHIIPQSDGGTDDLWNVVSCCFACNTLKMTDAVNHFLWVYPFGSDLERNKTATAHKRYPFALAFPKDAVVVNWDGTRVPPTPADIASWLEEYDRERTA